MGAGQIINGGSIEADYGITATGLPSQDMVTVRLDDNSVIVAGARGVFVSNAQTTLILNNGASVVADGIAVDTPSGPLAMSVAVNAQVRGGSGVAVQTAQNASTSGTFHSDFVVIRGASTTDPVEGVDPLNNNGARIDGDIRLGWDSDVILIGLGARVDGIVDGGTGFSTDAGELDQLQLGTADQTYCTSDPFDPAARAAEINALDGSSGSHSVAGQTYTFQDFEQVRAGFTINVCEGRIADGRLNQFDLAAPVVSYCTTDGGLAIFEVGAGGQGTLSLGLSRDRLNAALAQAVATGQHQEVARDEHGTVVYALNDGTTIQINSPDVNEPGKTYTTMHTVTSCDA